MKRALVIVTSLIAGLTFSAAATPSYHAVGWVNALIPGAGEAMLGNYALTAEQAALEISTFGWGYKLSARQPFTLDGVPESLPSTEPSLLDKPTEVTICTRFDAAGKCLRYRKVRRSVRELGYDGKPQDISKPLYADILQEVGLKAHMVNVFDAYRKAAVFQGVDMTAAQIDTHSDMELLSAPFKKELLKDKWVYIPLITTAAVLYLSYKLDQGHVDPIPPFNARSTALYNATYLGVFPFGSAAPEEMFYRGFLQSELYAASGTPWISVPVTAALYSFSHSPDAQIGAAVSGLYLGYMAYHNQGDLRRGIAYHFWSDVMTGIYSIALLKLAQSQANYSAPNISFNFEF